MDTVLSHKKDEYDLLPDGYYWHYNDLSKASPWNVYRDKITRVQIKDDVVLVNCDQLFAGLNKMTSISMPQDLSQCETMLGMFDGCTSLVSFDLSGRDTSKVTDLRYLFRNCVSLRWVWINDIDTRNVTNMRFMFQACAELVNVDVSNFDTSSLEQIAGFVHGCTKLASVDFSKYTIPDDIDYNIGWLFTRCSSIQRINFGANKMHTFHNFNPDIPTTYPYTGKWVKEDDPSIVLTTEEYVANYPNDIAPQGTYIWQVVNDTAIVQFDENGGETVRPSITQKDTVSLIHLGADGTAREGYKLIGWNTERDGSGENFPVDSEYIPELGKNVILYAQWQLAPLTIEVESNSDDFGSATVSWPTYDYRNKNFKVYQSADGRETWNSVGIDYTSVKEVRCLQIYPCEEAQGQLKEWIEDSNFGKGIIKVTPVSFSEFNADPAAQLRSNSAWNHDVVFIGCWDSNGGYPDLTVDAANQLRAFVQSGRGIIFGHDTIYEAKMPNLGALAEELLDFNWADASLREVVYTGNPSHGLGDKYSTSKIRIENTGLLVNYPWNIGSKGDVLEIPFTHINAYWYSGKIWMRFWDQTYSDFDMLYPSNVYCITDNNKSWISTGHAMGRATEDEQKILANLIFYMNQLLFDAGSLRDASAQDTASPAIHSHSIGANGSSSPIITLDAEDFGTTYSYYAESYSKDDTTETGKLATSNIEDVTVTTGLKTYYYLFDDFADTKISRLDMPGLTSQPIGNISYAGNEGKYMHVIAVDGAGNISDTYTVLTPMPAALDIEIVKTMKDGTSIADGEFSFSLYKAKTTNYTATGTATAVATVKCGSDGLASFHIDTPDIIPNPGTYAFCVKENSNADMELYYEMDGHTEGIKVVATDNGDGTMSLAYEYDMAAGDPTDGVVFENTRQAAPLYIENHAYGVSSQFMEREYEFEIHLTDPNGFAVSNVPYHRQHADESTGKVTELENGTISSGDKFRLKDGETMMLETGHGTSFKLIESTPAGFATTYYDDNGSHYGSISGTLDTMYASPGSLGTLVKVHNDYSAKGAASISGIVENDGARVRDGQYSFTLTDMSTGQKVSTTSNAEDGTFSFPDVYFNQKQAEQAFAYKVSQVVPTEPGNYIYDTEDEIVYVTVIDHGDGTLSFETSYEKSGEKSDGPIPFVNGYAIQMPETGQSGIAIGIAIGAVLIIAAIVGFVFGRKKDDNDEN